MYFDMMSCLYTIRNDDFVIAGWAEGAQPAFLWLLLEVCDGEVARHLGGGTVNDYQIDRSHGRLGL